jgi:hypothetical protein
MGVIDMLNFDKRKLYKKLTEQLGWAPSIAEASCETLIELDDRLQAALDRWLGDEKADDFMFDGISIRKVMIYYRYSFIQALYRMDTLMNHPDKRDEFKKHMNDPVFTD